MTGGALRAILPLVALVLLAAHVAVASPVGFDVRQHLSTTSRYGAGKALEGVEDGIPPVPKGCEPIHLNLVARHGTRSPTKNRIKELNGLAARLAELVDSDPAGNARRPAWLVGFRSPWEGRKGGGELIQEGEEDMYNLGRRMRERFPELFKYDYHSSVYPITATQVPRAAASAVALGMGLFGGTGSLGGAAKQRAFSVITDSRKEDIHLRFHESCMRYKHSKKLRKPKVQGWQDGVYADVAAAVSARYALNLTKAETASLWLLCKQEASTLDIADHACGLFSVSEVELLEWADDLEAHYLKGYGEAINYRMGVHLLRDVVTTMERAVSASEGLEGDESLEVAKLRVAHAETVIPFTCLLGLFLEDPDVSILQSEEPMKYARRPPQQRRWKGSLVAPFGANTQLILYKCPRGDSEANSGSTYLVQALHNEKPVTMPACKGAHFCPFAEFRDTVAGPHLQNDFEKLCSVEEPPVPPEVSTSWAQKLLNGIRKMLLWPCQKSPEIYTPKSEL